ncbi:tRNA lysidine(34) synthetase TilS [Marinobacter sp. F4216]|uniref:tRNA lysidine(34) synthetase TilS n=1 Tax=Marinobacter sp. F4216 TaxID=2874281 RepID=UPI001CC16A08|nr:tRNA lysidine(34) synthetase TilS [Marinobacter sp. F4216]MBZ2169867.1 tRNA lysidine(34) synthetase TilS [Marinobacter sp. F4216]
MTAGDKPDAGFAWPDALCAAVRSLPSHSRLWVAVSGGLDSILLLHLTAACHDGKVPLAAIHVNHQLQKNAGEAEALCVDACRRLDISLEVRRVSVEGRPGLPATAGIEEAARNARYTQFEQILRPGDLLLMAHHADDQAETVLFRLLRGSGVAGLAGMPVHRRVGHGHLFRPLLPFARADLERYAREAGLRWIDDPSNNDQVFDRNFLRHSVLSEMKSRWPELLGRVRRSADACHESDVLNQILAERQWAECSDGESCLKVERFAALSLPEQKNLLRWWILQRDLPLPSVVGWEQAIHDLILAGEDRMPFFQGDGFSLRRFQSKLYLLPDAPPSPSEPLPLNPGEQLRWGIWTLRLEPTSNPTQPVPPIRVSTRQGGERVRPYPEGRSKSLKNWFQEQGVPPWERPCLPLIFVGFGDSEQLIAIGDFWCSDQYSGCAPAAGWRLVVGRDCD